jgi:hypothetical protein
MSQAKPYTISLAVRGPDGRRFAYVCEATPTGFSSTSPASFWMLLHANLEVALTTAKLEVVDSSRSSPQRERWNS